MTVSGVVAVIERAEHAKPRLPRTQQAMAELIVRQRVAYNPTTATFYRGSGDDVAVKGEGRALRGMLADRIVEVDDAHGADERGAFPLRLTEEGRARYRA